MKDLIIIGARGYGRELYDIAIQCREYNTEWTIKGFLDDKDDALQGFEGYPPVLGSVEAYEVQENDVFTCALGGVEFKKKYISMVVEKGGNFVNIIHPTVIVSSHAQIGKGFIGSAYAFVSSNAVIGDFVTVQTHAAIGHDVKIGDWSVINSFVFFGGFCQVGSGVLIGAGARIIPRSKIGDNAVVGIGSIVMRTVKPNTTVFGSPAKEIF